MLNDDGDIARGLGFVSMYSAWIEEDVDDLLRFMKGVEDFDYDTQRWPISQKLKHAAKIVRRLSSVELDSLPDDLEAGVSLFERRNEVIHGRIYAGHDSVDYLQAGRRNVPTRPISSAELYQLANDFWAYRGSLTGPQLFRLPRAVERFLDGGG